MAARVPDRLTVRFVGGFGQLIISWQLYAMIAAGAERGHRAGASRGPEIGAVPAGPTAERSAQARRLLCARLSTGAGLRTISMTASALTAAASSRRCRTADAATNGFVTESEAGTAQHEAQRRDGQRNEQGDGDDGERAREPGPEQDEAERDPDLIAFPHGGDGGVDGIPGEPAAWQPPPQASSWRGPRSRPRSGTLPGRVHHDRSPQVAAADCPGSSRISPSPVRNALGAQVIGSTPRPVRQCGAAWVWAV